VDAVNLKSVPHLLKATVDAWLEDRAMTLAASLAFYTLLSLAPLLVVAVSVAGFIFGKSAARQEIAQQLRAMMGEDAGAAVESILAHANKAHANIVGTVVGWWFSLWVRPGCSASFKPP
jgi:membrane protein